jgi:hypothetical protein
MGPRFIWHSLLKLSSEMSSVIGGNSSWIILYIKRRWLVKIMYFKSTLVKGLLISMSFISQQRKFRVTSDDVRPETISRSCGCNVKRRQVHLAEQCTAIWSRSVCCLTLVQSKWSGNCCATSSGCFIFSHYDLPLPNYRFLSFPPLLGDHIPPLNGARCTV